eukprot:TRINITY_DN1802_c0_g1_i1.p1 TRINITY_DN1802_c0_g1~~TRINITY_DN1802_c0_g1_i1.p1  ORF type:complete len:132 (+),score=33.55 TRINITY_DN1802_c0_g1_i1:289-684(+)
MSETVSRTKKRKRASSSSPLSSPSPPSSSLVSSPQTSSSSLPAVSSSPDSAGPIAKKMKMKKKGVVKGMSTKQLKLFQEEQDRKGIVYLSRIPPKMTPLKLRHLLQPYGTILRIFLAPEGKVWTTELKNAI